MTKSDASTDILTDTLTDTVSAIGSNAIAFQGAAGANSHLACSRAFPALEPLACNTFEDVFAAVEQGRAKFGMLPIENTTAGRVGDAHRLLPHMGLYIVGEHLLPVEHHLMAPAGVDIGEINVVRSHIMAIDQCRIALSELGVASESAVDTAGAAKQLAQTNEGGVGVLASKLAAELYGLNILRHHLEDNRDNVTRFLILASEPADLAGYEGPCITSFVFRVRNVPAALYKALGGFATNGVNMTRLESCHVDKSFRATQFYADIEGQPSDKSVGQALQELRYFSAELRMLGTYPASREF